MERPAPRRRGLRRRPRCTQLGHLAALNAAHPSLPAPQSGLSTAPPPARPRATTPTASCGEPRQCRARQTPAGCAAGGGGPRNRFLAPGGAFTTPHALPQTSAAKLHGWGAPDAPPRPPVLPRTLLTPPHPRGTLLNPPPPPRQPRVRGARPDPRRRQRAGDVRRAGRPGRAPRVQHPRQGARGRPANLAS